MSPSVKRILTDKRTNSSDYRCIYTNKENIENMIKLFDVTSAHHQTTEITFDMLTSITNKKACDEWNFVINSEKSLIKDMLMQAKLDKREELANKETKDDDDVDELKYNPDDSPPYTSTVKNHSSEFHGSKKTFFRSLFFNS